MAENWQKLGTAKIKFCDNIIANLKTAHFSGVRFLFVEQRGEMKMT